ncbi:MAG: hypothetical protein ACREPQ_14350 [Rhodanobacter sp.]
MNVGNGVVQAWVFLLLCIVVIAIAVVAWLIGLPGRGSKATKMTHYHTELVSSNRRGASTPPTTEIVAQRQQRSVAPPETSPPAEGDFPTSALVGAATGNAAIGMLAGGSIVGAMLGPSLTEPPPAATLETNDAPPSEPCHFSDITSSTSDAGCGCGIDTSSSPDCGASNDI